MKVKHPCADRWQLTVLMLTSTMALVSACDSGSQSPGSSPSQEKQATNLNVAVTYVGGSRCSMCHAEQANAWRGSQHDLAMQEVGENSVLGDFDDAQFHDGGVTTTFFRRGDRFMVSTDGPGGELHDYAVRYTFGVSPLQQYLVELDGGRLQALSIAWDSRPRAAGGQRWYDLYPDEKIDYRDVLHWTRRSHNWNHMCADCHSTGFEKRYDQKTRSYASHFAEINVSCEACHGPGSRHVAWAEGDVTTSHMPNKGLLVPLDERHGVTWQLDPTTGKPQRSAARKGTVEIETCARCHSRRTQLAESPAQGLPLADAYDLALLREGLYEDDGQIRDEVYVYGSFLQSRMYGQGVTCSDCHDPHSANLRVPGSSVCFQCHQAEKYADAAHHHHKVGSVGSQCIECHMPSRIYMGVDRRRDHSFRIPRPDLTVELGTPNTCNACHVDKTPEWAREQVRQLYGHDPHGLQHFARAFHGWRSGDAAAENQLIGFLLDTREPAIVRATAAAELADAQSRSGMAALLKALNDEDALVRSVALAGLGILLPDQRWAQAAGLLHDPVLMVRLAAVSALASAGPAPAAYSTDWQSAADEYLAAQHQIADQPEGQFNLGNFEAARGRPAAAEQDYREAIALDPDWPPAYVNLADLLRAQDREQEGEGLLRDGLAHIPQAAILHYSLGLLLVRRQQAEQALQLLARAFDLEPGNPLYGFVYSVALNDAGKTAEARRVADAALEASPADQSLVDWRTYLNHQTGQ